jgi:hypothetical protein
MTDPTLAERLARCLKPLEWRLSKQNDQHWWITREGRYTIFPRALAQCSGYVLKGFGTFPTIEAAQAAAQADYTARSLAALDLDALAREVEAERDEARLEAYDRRHMNAPEDPHVEALCVRYGYGAVMDAASRLWARRDSLGAFYIGGCIGLRGDAEAAAILRALAKREEG